VKSKSSILSVWILHVRNSRDSKVEADSVRFGVQGKGYICKIYLM